jgi:acyl-coenzyme A thioesterase PaaI-like protein
MLLLCMCLSSCSAATLVDVLGTAALVTTSDSGGVSLALSTHYLRPAPLGSLVLVDAQVRPDTGA